MPFVQSANNAESSYLDLLRLVLEQGELVPNRTGVSAITYPHAMIRHDMANGFPLFTTKKMAWKSIRVELEFFIKGMRDKRWLQERGCTIWDEWANPAKIPSSLDGEARKEFQRVEPDLGPVYGVQWRNFNNGASENERCDQLKYIVNRLKTHPNDRQLVCSAWNPCQIAEQALPPCHTHLHVFSTNGTLHLCWFQRSVDLFLGCPFNIASYAILLHLLAKESGMKEGVLAGFLSNVHIYENHLEAVKTQIARQPFSSPRVKTDNFTSIFEWQYDDTTLSDYECHPVIKAEIAI